MVCRFTFTLAVVPTSPEDKQQGVTEMIYVVPWTLGVFMVIVQSPALFLTAVKDTGPLFLKIVAPPVVICTNPEQDTTTKAFMSAVRSVRVDAKLVPFWHEISPLVVKEPMLLIPEERVKPLSAVSEVTDMLLVTNVPKGVAESPRT